MFSSKFSMTSPSLAIQNKMATGSMLNFANNNNSSAATAMAPTMNGALGGGRVGGGVPDEAITKLLNETECDVTDEMSEDALLLQRLPSSNPVDEWDSLSQRNLQFTEQSPATTPKTSPSVSASLHHFHGDVVMSAAPMRNGFVHQSRVMTRLPRYASAIGAPQLPPVTLRPGVPNMMTSQAHSWQAIAPAPPAPHTQSPLRLLANMGHGGTSAPNHVRGRALQMATSARMQMAPARALQFGTSVTPGLRPILPAPMPRPSPDMMTSFPPPTPTPPRSTLTQPSPQQPQSTHPDPGVDPGKNSAKDNKVKEENTILKQLLDKSDDDDEDDKMNGKTSQLAPDSY